MPGSLAQAESTTSEGVAVKANGDIVIVGKPPPIGSTPTQAAVGMPGSLFQAERASRQEWRSRPTAIS